MQASESRRERQRSEVRRAIVDAAGSLIDEDGADGLSMRRLAARCGYTVPTVYHHFGDKDGVIDAVVDEAFVPLVAELEAVVPGADPVDYVRALVATFVAYARAVPGHYALLMVPRAEGRPHPPAVERAREILLAALTRLGEAGCLRGVDPEAAAQVVWVVTHGLIALPAQRPDLEWEEDLCDLALESVLHGLVDLGGGRS